MMNFYYNYSQNKINIPLVNSHIKQQIQYNYINNKK